MQGHTWYFSPSCCSGWHVRAQTSKKPPHKVYFGARPLGMTCVAKPCHSLSLTRRILCSIMFTKIMIVLKTILTHWGRVTHICVSKLTIFGSDNGFIWTNAGMLLIRIFRTNFSEIFKENFFKENPMENFLWKMAAILSRPQCVKAMLEQVPSKMMRSRVNLPWFYSNLKRQCKRKQRLYNRAKRQVSLNSTTGIKRPKSPSNLT